jgi:phage gp36-like protein
MATWVTLTVNDVLSGMTLAERDSFAKTSVGVSVPDRVAPILTDLVAEIQGMIASRADNPVPPSASVIPAEFKARAVSIARWRLLITIPNYQPGDSRKLDYENAEAFFMKVAEGKIRPRAEAVSGAAAPVASQGRWNSENRLRGRMNPTPPPAGAATDYANPDSPADNQ